MNNYQVAYSIAAVLACAVALGLALFTAALVQALWRDPDLVVPATEQVEQVAAHPVGPGEFAPDLAWPYYPYRQSRTDRGQTRRNVARGNGALWRRPARAFFRTSIGWWVLLPIPVTIVSFLLVVSLTSWLCYLVYALVNAVCEGASLAILRPAAAIARGAERGRRVRMQAQTACTHCFHVTPWPAYQCPQCLRSHHDVRPGRLGLLVRRCYCGRHLPTMASRAAWQLTPLCKRCGKPLPTGAGAVRDIRIPVFGDISAGKTRFLFAGLNSLIGTAGRNISFPDEDSAKLAEFGLGVIRSGRETAKTSTNAQVTLNCLLGSGRGADLVHLFDAAGEHFRSARRPEALRFLDDGQGLVYVLDPFSIESVRKESGGRDAPALRLAHAAAGDPELTYDEVTSRLRDSGVAARGQRLAVVVSKADLLRSAGVDLPADSAEIARWLRDRGVHNLVMSAPHEFAEVRFFKVASQNIRPGSPDDPGAPLRWLLSSQGVRLPLGIPDQRSSSGRPTLPTEPAEARS